MKVITIQTIIIIGIVLHGDLLYNYNLIISYLLSKFNVYHDHIKCITHGLSIIIILLEMLNDIFFYACTNLSVTLKLLFIVIFQKKHELSVLFYLVLDPIYEDHVHL